MFSQPKNNHEKTNGFQNSHHLTKALFTLACKYSRLFPPASPGTQDVLRDRLSIEKRRWWRGERRDGCTGIRVHTNPGIFENAFFFLFYKSAAFYTS